jgi:hypothetical protein
MDVKPMFGTGLPVCGVHWAGQLRASLLEAEYTQVGQLHQSGCQHVRTPHGCHWHTNCCYWCFCCVQALTAAITSASTGTAQAAAQLQKLSWANPLLSNVLLTAGADCCHHICQHWHCPGSSAASAAVIGKPTVNQCPVDCRRSLLP